MGGVAASPYTTIVADVKRLRIEGDQLQMDSRFCPCCGDTDDWCECPVNECYGCGGNLTWDECDCPEDDSAIE